MVNIFEYFKNLENDNVLLSFKGHVTFDLVKSVLDIIESYLEDHEKDVKIKRKVYNVLVEGLQNLSHHIDEVNPDSKEYKSASLLIWKDDNGYYVGTGNYVEKSKVEFLTERIERVNSVSKDELRSLYKEILNNQQFSNKGGGGLGFIDIARKSGQKLKYAFHDSSENISFFNLEIAILRD